MKKSDAGSGQGRGGRAGGRTALLAFAVSIVLETHVSKKGQCMRLRMRMRVGARARVLLAIAGFRILSARSMRFDHDTKPVHVSYVAIRENGRRAVLAPYICVYRVCVDVRVGVTDNGCGWSSMRGSEEFPRQTGDLPPTHLFSHAGAMEITAAGLHGKDVRAWRAAISGRWRKGGLKSCSRCADCRIERIRRLKEEVCEGNGEKEGAVFNAGYSVLTGDAG